MKRLVYIALIFSVIFAGFGLRDYNASTRITHGDEAEQAVVFAKLFDGDGYFYNPNGQHGPTLYYFAALVQKALGKSDSSEINIGDLRRSMGIFSLLIFISFLLFGREIGRGAAWGACGAFAISSLASIYSVYFVQEIIFAFLIFALSMSVWFFIKNPSAISAVSMGIFAGLAQATKETSIIAFASIALAACAEIFTSRNFSLLSRKSMPLWGLAFFGFFTVFVLFFSSFGFNWRGLSDAFFSYSHYFEKAGNKDFSGGPFFYLKLLFLQKREAFIFGDLPISLLALAGFFLAIKGKRRNIAIYLALCSGLQILILSVLTYKTPWLLLSAEVFICALAGMGVQAILSQKKILYFLGGFLAISLLAFWQYKLAERAAKTFHSDSRNPFIFSHTVYDFNNLVSRIGDCSKNSEYGREIPIAFVTSVSPWPAPWELRKYPNVGYWMKNSIPETLDVFELILTDPASEKLLKGKIDEDKYESEFFGLRENLILTLRIKKSLAEKVFK